MARNTGRFNRLLELIGLVDEEPEEEKATSSSRRSAAQENRSRYGTTSSGTAYSGGSRTSRSPGYSASSYGSSGRAASYTRDPYTYRSGTRSAASRYGEGEPFERAPAAERRTASVRSQQQERDELEFDAPPTRRTAPAERTRTPAAPRQNPPAVRDSRHHMIVYYLRQLDECRDVIADLLEGKSVLLNLEDMDDRDLQRAIDTLGGAAFALDATLRKAADRTFLIAPRNVDIATTNSDHYDRR